MNFYSSKEENIRMFKLDQSAGGSTINNNGVPMSPAPPKIQKVTILLRDNKNLVEYFEPRVVSLGPIHHGKEAYHHAEMSKLKLAREFVRNSGKTIEEFCHVIETQIKKLREYFEAEVTNKYSDDYLAWIFLVDGCAILQFMYFYTKLELKELNMKMYSVTYWLRDLFLMENQVPYYLLLLLTFTSDHAHAMEMMGIMVVFVMAINSKLLMNWQESSLKQVEDRLGDRLKDHTKITHLLDLLRTSLLGPEKSTEQKEWLNQLLQIGDQQQRVERGTSELEWASRDLNVKKLQSVGIHVKRSAANSFRDISFSRRLLLYSGYLKLPPLVVDLTTGPMFLNLIAYEMCPDFENDLGVSSFIGFISTLIHEVNDVKELINSKVLCGPPGNHEEVVQLFRTISDNVMPNLDEHMHLKGQIQAYFGNKSLIWMAELFYDIFSRPWKIVAFFGSLFALLLTAAQTIYSPSGPCDDLCKKLT